jgi:endonuclease YncB( thermonuclease family)
MPSKQLTKNTYRKLLDDIAGIYDRALKDVHVAVEAILKTAYWKIGQRVVEVEQDGHIRAQYGTRLLEQISTDMSKTNRKGFSVTNLKNMRLVYQAFSIRQISGELGWSHFVVLSAVKDKKDRRAYLNKAVEKKWNVEQLRDALVRNQVKTLPSGNGEPNRLAAPPAKAEVLRLAFKRGVINAYRVLEPDPDDPLPGGNSIQLDCGFGVTRAFKLLSKISVKPGDVVVLAEPALGAAKVRKITSPDLKAGSILYTYAARVVKVIDGDTLKVKAKLGETERIRKKLRLRKIDAPEIDTPEGKKAKDFVVKALKDCPWIVIKTYSTDIYDRYLVDIFYLPGCDDPAKIALEGKLLNQELLDAGLADLWRTPDPLDLAMLN